MARLFLSSDNHGINKRRLNRDGFFRVLLERKFIRCSASLWCFKAKLLSSNAVLVTHLNEYLWIFFLTQPQKPFHNRRTELERKRKGSTSKSRKDICWTFKTRINAPLISFGCLKQYRCDKEIYRSFIH